MHKHIGMGKGVEGEIAGTVTRIAIDDHCKLRLPELCRILRCPSFESCGKLEGYFVCPPLL
jgi:hypothetical protein